MIILYHYWFIISCSWKEAHKELVGPTLPSAFRSAHETWDWFYILLRVYVKHCYGDRCCRVTGRPSDLFINFLMSVITMETRVGLPPGNAVMACPVIEARRISDNCRQRVLEILTKSLRAAMETHNAPMRTRFAAGGGCIAAIKCYGHFQEPQ
jgi:hypothetical protein